MRNVCPDCEANIVPRLHPSVVGSFSCRHVVEQMTPDELRQMFPAADNVFREVYQKHITQREATFDVAGH